METLEPAFLYVELSKKQHPYSTSAPGDIPKGIEDRNVNKYLCTHVHGSVFIAAQTNQMSIDS